MDGAKAQKKTVRVGCYFIKAGGRATSEPGPGRHEDTALRGQRMGEMWGKG